MSSLKKTSQKVVMWILVVVISVVFIWAFSLVGGGISTGRISVGTVNGKSIDDFQNSEFSRLYAQMAENYREYTGGAAINDSIAYQINQTVFRQLAMQELMLMYAKNNLLYVSPKEIVDAVKQRYFVDKNGQYSEAAYQQFVRTGQQSDKKNIEKETITQLTVSMLNGGTLFAWAAVPQFELESRLKLRSIKKNAIVATFNSYEAVVASVNDADLRAYFNQNKDRFEQNALFETVYTQVKNSYVQANYSFLSSQIVSTKRTEIENALVSGKFNSDFKSAAKNLGMKVENLSEVNYYSESLLNSSGEEIKDLSAKEVVPVLFSLGKGELSKVNDFSTGIYLAIITDEQVTETSSSSFLNEKIKKEIEDEKANLAMQSFQNSLYSKAKVKFALPAPKGEQAN